MRTSRRQFLKTGAVVSAAAIMSYPLNSLAGKEDDVIHPTQLIVASGKSPGENTRKVIEALGGMEKFVKKGDKVLFAKWAGTEVKVNNEDLLIMKESDILGIIE